jgi:ADP-ribose pyrophosphatase
MFTEKTTQEHLLYEGRVVRVYELQVELHTGETARREVVRHNGGACILAIDDQKNAYLVRQYRKAIEKHTLEIAAGKLEPGEDPLVCATRELLEETGICASQIESLGWIYPTPGYCDEKLYLYLATGLSHGESSPDPDEYLECVKVPLAQCLEKIESGEINDAKTVIALLRTASSVLRVR